MLRTFGIHHRFQFPQLCPTSGEPILQYHLWSWVRNHLWLIGEYQHDDKPEGSRPFLTYVVIVASTWFKSPVDRRDKGPDVEINKQVLVFPCADVP